MADLALDEFVQRAISLGVVEMEQVQEIWHVFGTQNVRLEEFLQAALRRGILTKYQVERLKFGETTGFYFGPYKVLYLVGAGTFSRVYRAVHKKTGQVVAVKVLRARFSQEPAIVEMFIREARFSMGLQHPNIVKVYDVISDNTGNYMVMDFIEGQTLKDLIRVQKTVQPVMAIKIISDICSALDFAYKRGHSHRDMKLTNVLISSSGKAVLIDFGLSATEKEVEQNVKLQRTVDYAALEKITGVQRNDKRSDIYFVGTIMYYMLAGVSPILETKDRQRRMERARFLNVIPLRDKNPSVPPLLCFIVEKAMSLDVDKRYQTPGGMLLDLDIATQKLEKGDTSEFVSAESNLAAANAAKLDTARTTILVLEDNPDLQNVFRETMKNMGFRVLVISDSERALERFEYPDHGIDCVLFNAQSLGAKALLAFNRLAMNPSTENLPAILLLAESQVSWGAKAKRNKHRLAVGMPISLSRLSEVIRRLVQTPQL